LGQHLTGASYIFLVGSILAGCSLYPDVNTDPAKNNKATRKMPWWLTGHHHLRLFDTRNLSRFETQICSFSFARTRSARIVQAANF
jgi:hypothetical protein